MRIANYAGRLVLDTPTGVVDVMKASEGRFASDPQAIYDRWEEFAAWAAEYVVTRDSEVHASATLSTVAPERFEVLTPRPPQILAIGLNYADHAAESGLEIPEAPLTFTKFASSLAPPIGELPLSGDQVDWEVEMVLVIGRTGHHIAAEHAWEHVAGITVGQDYSDRALQFLLSPPQFSLGKSFPGYAPIGPWLVTSDEFADRDDIEVSCEVNGMVMQKSRTSQLIFDVPTLLAYLSSICPLLPGDLIFTGTPAGVGQGRSPQVYLKPGDEVVTTIENVGALRQSCVPADRPRAALA